MNKKGLLYFFAAFSVISLTLLGLGCASIPIKDMTKEVDRDLRRHNRSIDGFRFLVSTNVTLTLVERDIDITGRGTTVHETIVRNVIHLNANTTGRLLSGDVDSGLNVFFENPDRAPIPPTLTFIEKSAGGRFYFKYENHPTLANIVNYNGVQYQVTWRGNEEPYLRYQETQTVRTNTRTMRGVN